MPAKKKISMSKPSMKSVRIKHVAKAVSRASNAASVVRAAAPPSGSAIKKGNGPLKGLFSTLGAMAGDIVGGPAGGAIGGAAGNWLSSIVGFGDYSVKSNNLLDRGVVTTSQQAPKFANAKAETRVQHREYIADVIASEEFSLQQYVLNPGNVTTFPWLSTVATSYENYKFNGLVFQYIPTSGQVTATNPALGAVMLATNYDSIDPDFTSKREMDSYEFSTTCVPYQSMMHPIECKPNTLPVDVLYVRVQPEGSISLEDNDIGDPRLYDLGVTQIATQGMSSTYTCGELWVSYDVTFYKPRISPTTTVPVTVMGFYGANDLGIPLLYDVNPQIVSGDFILYNTMPKDTVVRQTFNRISINAPGVFGVAIGSIQPSGEVVQPDFQASTCVGVHMTELKQFRTGTLNYQMPYDADRAYSISYTAVKNDWVGDEEGSSVTFQLLGTVPWTDNNIFVYVWALPDVLANAATILDGPPSEIASIMSQFMRRRREHKRVGSKLKSRPIKPAIIAPTLAGVPVSGQFMLPPSTVLPNQMAPPGFAPQYYDPKRM